ncbi:MAG: universal stress protein [Desulfobacterium sp.]|nr:universal stress protein [Desulfobacterium sp.]MBU3946751.1 universal stress protein [Pseudomonadota bacterium]MBU4036721.1 universal stress protein [Pseudomonadota bacterium]
MTFKNILVPTDLTEKSKKVFDIAISMITKDMGKITLIHIIEMIEGIEDEDMSSFYKKLSIRARKKMDEVVLDYKDRGLTINTEIIIGKRVPEIIRIVHERSIDLIILKSHKIEEVCAGEGWATISYKIAIMAPCPVMIVK